MGNTNKRKIIGFSILAVLLISLITLLFFVNPEDIVTKIGVRNGYILAFIVSFFGGFSAGGSFSFISFLITLVIGGMNPIYLGLIAGISLAIGDIIMFYAGSRGRELIRRKWDKKIDQVANIFKKRKWLEKLTPLLAYLYIGFAPLPNDVLILFLAAIEFPSKKMNWIIILGDITFALMITMLAAKGIMIFI
jgi:membrane protein DedA with SNARE-associated domain